MEEKLTDIKNALFRDFQIDHSALGEKLFALRTALIQRSVEAAQSIAEEIDRDAGAHMAFEEKDFYPALKKFLTEDEVFRMYLEHADGLAMIVDIIEAEGPEFDDPEFMSNILEHLERMDHHVADCGDLFGALGGLEPSQYQTLYDRLHEWKRKAPSWREIDPNCPHEET